MVATGVEAEIAGPGEPVDDLVDRAEQRFLHRASPASYR